MSWAVPLIPALLVYGATAKKTIDTLVWINGWVQWARTTPAPPDSNSDDWQWVEMKDDPECFELVT